MFNRVDKVVSQCQTLMSLSLGNTKNMNDKKQQLIDTALNLFYQHGVGNIGINEILKTSGIAKKTLYNHFKSKEDLVLAALQQRDNDFIDWLDSILLNGNSEYEKVQSLFYNLTEWFHGRDLTLGEFRGCLFINTSAQFSQPDNAISQYCLLHKERVKKHIQSSINFTNEDILDWVCILKEGAITAAYVCHDLNVADKCFQLISPHLNHEKIKHH